MRVHDLLIQQVFFVQEKNGGGFFEPRGGEDGLEQGEALLESILRVSEVSQKNFFFIFFFFDISKEVFLDEMDGVWARTLRRSRSHTGPGRTR